MSNRFTTYRAETSKALVTYKCVDRIKSYTDDIDTQVKLDPIKQKRLVDISLDDKLFVLGAIR